MTLDPRTPVIVGVGQASERLDDPGYRRRSPVDLAADAARAALADAAGDGRDTAALASAIDTVAGVRQFEDSTPGARAPLGRSDNYPRSVAGRIGASPARAVLEVTGGQAPQHLVNEFAGVIAAGRAEVVLLFGSEAISTIEHLAKAEKGADRPDFTEHADGSLEDRGYGLRGIWSWHTAGHGLVGPVRGDRQRPPRPAQAEQGRVRGRHGRPVRAVHPGGGGQPARIRPGRAGRGRTGHPDRPEPPDRGPVYPFHRRPGEGQPGRRRAAHVSRGGARSGRARGSLGVPARPCRPARAPADGTGGPVGRAGVGHGRTECAGGGRPQRRRSRRHRPLQLLPGSGLQRPRRPRDRARRPARPHADRRAAVFRRGRQQLLDARHRGGGGARPPRAGLLQLRRRQRRRHEQVFRRRVLHDAGAVGARQQRRTPGGDRRLARAGAGGAGRRLGHDRVLHGHPRPGRRPDRRRDRAARSRRARFVAKGDERDTSLLDLLTESAEPIGARVYTRSFGTGNKVITTEERMNELFPPEPLVLRDRYEYLLVRRDGHLLEITINRPEARNSLHPMANEELDHVFDAYFADADLWVAILTGAGDKAFSAGNDLVYNASGKPMWVPKNGFAGLTSRRSMPKPVIAAVNGYAMGGGCEIALACQLAVADAGGLVRLPRTVPAKVATEMILTGRRVGADQALAYGLVNRVAPAGRALEEARALAAEILDGSPTSVRLSLQALGETRAIPDVIDAVTSTADVVGELMGSADSVEGMVAFVQKRRPVWRNY